MDEEIQAVADAFLGPLQASIAGIGAAMMPLLDALMVFVITATCLSAAFRRHDVLGSTWHCIFILGITRAAIEWWPQLLDWSINTAGQLSGYGGAGEISDPFSIASAGAALFNRAWDHADAISVFQPGTWVQGFFIVIAAIVIVVAYLILTAISLSAYIEFYAAGVVLAPLIAFLPVVGFTGAGFTPISFIMSATLRIAALGFVASFGTTLVGLYAIPPIGEQVTGMHVLSALGLAVVLGYIALRINGLITGILMGRPGWSGAGVVTGAIAAAGGLVMSGLTGMGGMTATAGAAGRGAGGGGAGGGSISSGMAAPVARRSAPVNSRTA